MSDQARSYPLQWPPGRKRTQYRNEGRFSSGERTVNSLGNSHINRRAITINEALTRLQNELDRIGAQYVVMSSNLEQRLDGLPRSNQSNPLDPGVAVYFRLDDKPFCLPCDTYTQVAQNIAAVAAHIKATRDIERHGVANIAEMFSGFKALPSPEMQRHWRDVLGFRDARSVSRDDVEVRFRQLARERHPDHGGSDSMMAELNLARARATQELQS